MIFLLFIVSVKQNFITCFVFHLKFMEKEFFCSHCFSLSLSLMNTSTLVTLLSVTLLWHGRIMFCRLH